MRRTRRGIMVALWTMLLSSPALAQGSCEYNGTNGNCTLGNSATYALNITISRAVRLALSTTGIALDSPIADDFDATYGQTMGPTLTIKSNAAWSLTTRVTTTTWSASPPPARADKPAAELLWATNAGGPFTAYTTVAAPVTSGVATAGTVLQLHFRVVYAWNLDTPGSYFIPVQFTITSP